MVALLGATALGVGFGYWLASGAGARDSPERPSVHGAAKPHAERATPAAAQGRTAPMRVAIRDAIDRAPVHAAPDLARYLDSLEARARAQRVPRDWAMGGRDGGRAGRALREHSPALEPTGSRSEVKYVLDTNVVSRVLDGDERVLGPLGAVEPHDVGIPLLVLAELLFGAEKSGRRDQNRRRIQVLTERFPGAGRWRTGPA